MQGQGGQLVKRTLIQLGRVDDVMGRNAVLHRTAVVTAGGVVFFDLRRHGLHVVGQAGQGGEQGRQAAVRTLGHLRRLLQQGLAAGRIELRIRAQEVQEAGEVAGPARRLHFHIHAGADAGDLVQTDLMDLVRRQVGRGVAAHKIGVQFLAAGSIADARLDRRLGQIVALEEGQPSPARGKDRSRNRRRRLCGQAILIRLRHGRGQGRQGFQQRLGVRLDRHIVSRQRQRAFGHRSRLDQAGVQAAPGVGGRLGVDLAKALDTFDIGLGLRDRVQPRAAADVVRPGSGAAFGVERQAAGVVVQPFQAAVERIEQEGVVDAAGVGKTCRGDGRQPPHEPFQRRALGQFELSRQVRHPAHRLHIALTAGRDRIDRLQIGLVVGDDGVQRGVCRGGCDGGGRRLRHGRNRRISRKHGCDSQIRNLHDAPPVRMGTQAEQSRCVNRRR